MISRSIALSLDDLIREKNPVIGTIEAFLVKSAALDMVKWLRAPRVSKPEYITSELNPPIQAPDPMPRLDLVLQGEILDPGLPAAINAESGQRLVSIFQRYETNIANRLFRTLHELERVQRMRQGERLPAPVAVDVSVHAETGGADAVSRETPKLWIRLPLETGTAVCAELLGHPRPCLAMRNESQVTKRGVESRMKGLELAELTTIKSFTSVKHSIGLSMMGCHSKDSLSFFSMRKCQSQFS